MASAISSGSRARVTAVASSTASQPSSMAMAASLAVPTPASSTTGTPAAATISSMLCRFLMPSPDPIGAPSGMTAAHPACSSRRASTGSSLVYGSTVNPRLTSMSAASSSSIGSGSRVCSSAITSSFTQSVPSASRASSAVCTASAAVWQPAVLGSTRMPRSVSRPSTDRPPPGATRRMATVVSSVPDAASARSSTSRLGAPPVPMISREPNFSPAMTRGSVMVQPPWTAVSTSTWSPSASGVDSHSLRRTTSPLTATAIPLGALVSTWTAAAVVAPSLSSTGWPLTITFTRCLLRTVRW